MNVEALHIDRLFFQGLWNLNRGVDPAFAGLLGTSRRPKEGVVIPASPLRGGLMIFLLILVLILVHVFRLDFVVARGQAEAIITGCLRHGGLLLGVMVGCARRKEFETKDRWPFASGRNLAWEENTRHPRK